MGNNNSDNNRNITVYNHCISKLEDLLSDKSRQTAQDITLPVYRWRTSTCLNCLVCYVSCRMNDIQELWLLCIKALLLLLSDNKDGVTNQCILEELSDFPSFSHLFF